MLRQFSGQGSSSKCFSYACFDPESREAIWIDPHWDLMEEYRKFIAENGLRPLYAIDTRLFTDHSSATHCFASGWNAQILGPRSLSPPPAELKAGRVNLRILKTPGVTSDSICLHWADPQFLFTGDTLWIGSTAAIREAELSPTLYLESLRSLATLPGSTRILPTHDAQGILLSTLEIERAKNLDFKLALESESEFISLKTKTRRPGLDAREEKKKMFNQNPDPSSPPEPELPGESEPVASGFSIASISVSKYQGKLRQSAAATDAVYMDVRERDEFFRGHIPETINVPMSELAKHVPTLLQKKQIYVSCLSGRRSQRVAQTLSYLGVSDVVNVTGGFQAWQKAGLPVEEKGEKSK
jgi:rhodanese-related sulfurtransferase/glyoxylase-like metal-dependent hydrolase (beta-lactamase superfamily II)